MHLLSILVNSLLPPTGGDGSLDDIIKAHRGKLRVENVEMKKQFSRFIYPVSIIE